MYKVLVKEMATNKVFAIKIKADSLVSANIKALKVLLEKQVYVQLIRTETC